MSQRPKHACFYSTKCKHSASFLEEIARTPYKSEFRFVCVDPSPNRPALPSWLKVVPTLLIDGEPDPLTDEKVFNWLSLRKIQGPRGSGSGQGAGAGAGAAPASEQSRYKEPARNEISSPATYDPTPPGRKMAEPIQTREAGSNVGKQVANPTGGDEPNAWHSQEMSGTGKWSDGYSFIEDDFSIKDGVGASRIERNFTLLDGMAFAQGGAQKKAEPSAPVSEKARALNNAMEDFRKKRDADLPASINRI